MGNSSWGFHLFRSSNLKLLLMFAGCNIQQRICESIPRHMGFIPGKGTGTCINQDLTSPICFLSGVASGALCVIVSGSWRFATHKSLTATVSLLSFLIGYFMVCIVWRFINSTELQIWIEFVRCFALIIKKPFADKNHHGGATGLCVCILRMLRRESWKQGIW